VVKRHGVDSAAGYLMLVRWHKTGDVIWLLDADGVNIRRLLESGLSALELI
jgi:hypothetical protein